MNDHPWLSKSERFDNDNYCNNLMIFLTFTTASSRGSSKCGGIQGTPLELYSDITGSLSAKRPLLV